MTGQPVEESSPPPRTSVLDDANELHKTQLLEQFYLTLQVTYLAAPPSESIVYKRIGGMFRDTHSWRNAYEIEQLLCFVISEQQLETELNRRLAEARTLNLEHVAVIDKELHSDATPSVDKRIVLHRLLNDLQWFYAKRVQHRAAGKRLMARVSLLFMVALATFSLVLFIQFFAHGPATAPVRAAAPDAVANPGAQEQADTPGGTTATTTQSAQDEPTTAGGVE